MANSLDDKLLQQPIIVIGAPRSGTTLLSSLLSHHPSLAFIGEPRLTWRYGNDSKSDMLRPLDATPKVCQHIRSTFANTVRQTGKQRLLEKHPSNSLRMGFVNEVLPGCLFVHITRNGVESVLSMQKYWQQHSSGINPTRLMGRLREIRLRQIPYYAAELARRLLPKGLARPPVWGPQIPGLNELVKELDVLEIACMQWRMCVESACQYGRQLPSDRYFECRLEDMSPDLFKEILAFCQLDDSPEVWNEYNSKFKSENTSHRRSEAPSDLIQQVERLIEPTLRWLNY